MSVVKEGGGAEGSEVPAAAELVEFATAVVERNADRIGRARDALAERLDGRGVVDAAAVIANFERMNRIADATGIPLDGAKNFLSTDIQAELGLRELHSAGGSPELGGLQKVIAGILRPIAIRLMPVIARNARKRMDRAKRRRN